MKAALDDRRPRAAWWPRLWDTGEPASPAALALRSDEVSRHAVRLVAVDRSSPGGVALHPFAALPRLLRAGDLVVVNDAATLPASLAGRTASGAAFELRLSAPVDHLPSHRPAAVLRGPAEPGLVDRSARLTGIVFGEGDWRTRTEHRPPPPPLAPGDRVLLGPTLTATVASLAGRRIALDTDATGDALWQALYAAGAPVQYAHRRDALPLWSVQTAYAARPWAVEMPSAGRPLTWDILLALRRAGIAIAALTHAAGLGSTGDAALDASLPWPERYELPEATAAAVAETHSRGGRVIAIGTTVVRALEASGGRAGAGLATQRLDATSRPRLVDGLVSGLHVPGESHYDLLRAFAGDDLLGRALERARHAGLSAHELGDALLIV